MRGLQQSRWLLMALVLTSLLTMTALAAEEFCACLDVDFAFRVSGECSLLPISFDDIQPSSGGLKLEGVLGLPEWSAAAWADINTLPLATVSFGGEAKLVREWLCLGVRAQPSEACMEWSFLGLASPAPWMLYEGIPSLVGGISATTQATILGDSDQIAITLSPFLTGIIPSGSTTVSPSIGLDIGLDSDASSPAISGSRLVSTINAGDFLVAGTVYFDGLFRAFSSLVMSVNVPEWGVAFSGSLMPTPTGDFSFRVGFNIEWGDTYLLSAQSEKPEAICTGGVCF